MKIQKQYYDIRSDSMIISDFRKSTTTAYVYCRLKHRLSNVHFDKRERAYALFGITGYPCR